MTGWDLIQRGEHRQHHSPQGAPWGKMFQGERAKRATPPPEALWTGLVFSFHQSTCLHPLDLSRRPLHPQISPPHLTLPPSGSKAQMAPSSLGLNMQWERGVGK